MADVKHQANKATVLRKYPAAYCAYTGAGKRVIYDGAKRIDLSEERRTAKAAWESAADKLNGGKDG